MVKEVAWLDREQGLAKQPDSPSSKLDGAWVRLLSLLADQPSSPSSKLDGVAQELVYGNGGHQVPNSLRTEGDNLRNPQEVLLGTMNPKILNFVRMGARFTLPTLLLHTKLEEPYSFALSSSGDMRKNKQLA